MTASKRYGSKVQLNYLQNGDVSFFIVYKIGKKTLFKKVGKKSEGITESKSIELRNQILSELRHGIDLSQKSVRTLTFDKLEDIYFNSKKAHNKSNDKYRQFYEKHIKPSFGNITVPVLCDELIVEFQYLKLAESLSEAYINMMVKHIKKITNHAVNKKIINHSPFTDVKLFKTDNSRLRYLSTQEINEILKIVEEIPVLHLFVLISLSTGARANSVLNIQKKHIDFKNKTVELCDFKRNMMYYIGYLDDKTINILENEMASKDQNSFVIGGKKNAFKYGTLYKKIIKILNKFNHGIDEDRKNKVVIHTLRHTFASHLAIAGVSIQKIQKLMNHKDIKQTMKYAKLSPDSGRAEVEELYK